MSDDPKNDVQAWTEQSGDSSTKGRARTPEQFKAMDAAEKEGICIFCHPDRWKNGPIRETEYWLIKPNDFPYKHHQLHLVVIWHPSQGHLEDVNAVSQEAWSELDRLLGWIIKEYSLPAMNFIVRFGDPDLRSSTIHHIHGHIQIPDSAVLPTDPPALDLEARDTLRSFNNCIAFSPEEVPHQRQFVVVPVCSPRVCFTDLMLGALEVIKDQRVEGGGIVFRYGDRQFTNAYYVNPHIKIYAPDGTGRVHATFAPARPGDKKPPCKATFCKGFSGAELEKLQARMEQFRNLE